MDLQLEHIVEFCCDFVQKRLTLKNVEHYWGLSNNKKLPTLRKCCLDLMQGQFESFVATSLFVELEFSDLQSIISSDDLQVDCEENVFGAIKKWIRTDIQKNRGDKLSDLLKCIRWSQTSKHFREKLLDNKDIFLKDSCCRKYLEKVGHHISNGGEYFNSKPRNIREPTINESEFILTLGKPSSDAEEWIAEIYDPATEQSKTLAHLTFREWAAVVPVGEEVMIVGGEVNGTTSPSVEVFSCRGKHSRLVASLKIARRLHGACSVGDAVVVFGGCDGKWNSLDSCEVYSENRWSLLPKMKEARRGVAVVSIPDRRVFAIGGCNGNNYLSSVEFCRLPVDFASSPPRPKGFWRSLASMREARWGHAAVLLRENLFVAEGYNGEYLSSIEMLPIANEKAQWVSLITSMMEKRCYFSLLVHSRAIFAFGNCKTPYNSVEWLQLGNNSNSKTASSSDFPSDTLSSSQWESLSPISSMQRVWNAVVIQRKLNL